MMTHIEWLMKTWRIPAWWSCRCSACVLQRQEKDDQYRDNAANGHL